MKLLWLLPTLAAALCDTVADLISDEVVGGDENDEDEDDKRSKAHLPLHAISPDLDADLVHGCASHRW
jgi:hypothetical protein